MKVRFEFIAVGVLLVAAVVWLQNHAQGQRLGAKATVHQTVLNWTQSTSPNITGNKVYKAAGLCGTANQTFNQLQNSGQPITTYTDTTVTAGAQACYYVTALCATCSPSESQPSNQVSATTPMDSQPAAPTGLAAAAQ